MKTKTYVALIAAILTSGIATAQITDPSPPTSDRMGDPTFVSREYDNDDDSGKWGLLGLLGLIGLLGRRNRTQEDHNKNRTAPVASR